MRILLIYTFLLFRFSATSQDTVRFTKALAVQSGSRYGREAIFNDLMSYRLIYGMKAPHSGDIFNTTNKDSIKWKEVESDNTGRFRVFGRRNFQRTNNPFLNPGAVDRGADYLYFSYISPKATVVILRVQGSAGLYFNGAPHMGDPYSTGYMHIPVLLKKGINELYVRGSNVLPEIIFSHKQFNIHKDDVTAPHIILGETNNKLLIALVVSNLTATTTNLQMKALLNGKTTITSLPSIPAYTTRKIIFTVDGSAISSVGKYNCQLTLQQNGKQIDQQEITLEAVPANTHYTETFISKIDGSLQYFSVTPQVNGSKPGSALFLSVHGAGVEAIGQARAYKQKDWGTIVAATNRRPRGFNWEDWGRLDALEVLTIAQNIYKPDHSRIYLTGHSMGGHGTWFLGATYPDKWAAIGPAAGYASLKEYGSADGKIPDSANSMVEQILLRSGNQSDVLKLATNYKSLGVYVLHGDSDRVVPVTYARQMRQVLSGFHKDFSYYEYPGGEHWFGDQSVDWPPMFEYFKWHHSLNDTLVNHIDFTTASPGISSSYRWASIIQQQHPLKYSNIKLSRNFKPLTISGTTQNVEVLKLELSDFKVNTAVKINLDASAPILYNIQQADAIVFLKKTNDQWSLISKPDDREKNPERYGTFKEAFNNNMLFIIGSSGNAEETIVNRNKAIYDAESWYYRGNGAIDIITDIEYSEGKYNNRNIILYGNAINNSVWKKLLANCPINVTSNAITAGNKTWQGNNLAAYFIWPQKKNNLLIGVVAASGIQGMKAAYANQYFAGGSGFPDFMIFSDEMLLSGARGVKLAGFFNNQWKIEDRELAIP